jgi:hypothetical protein
MSMQRYEEPAIGHWYDSKDFPECFRVVAYDRQALVEIQYYDGEVEEIDYDTWQTLHPAEIAEPEDASSGYEMQHEDIMEMLNEIERQSDESLEDHLRHIDEDDSKWG